MQNVENQIFKNYWSRKRFLEGKIPSFPVIKWYRTDSLCDIEQLYFTQVNKCRSILDVGAGDLRIKKKFELAGFGGEYHSQDVSEEHPHTYRTLSEVDRKYDAILCLDVIEHLSLSDGLALIQKMKTLLEKNGLLILQTPNARCVRNPMGWDMTHLHCYNLPDLWAYLTAEGFQTAGYRVVFSESIERKKFRTLLARYIITRVLGNDYADNIALIGQLKDN